MYINNTKYCLFYIKIKIYKIENYLLNIIKKIINYKKFYQNENNLNTFNTI